ncbi:hypothetical protein WISP_150515 [Willisornis vidua]|uniref:Uncharacterized protein n=1 Tax=Willisornis vidua TaxID=1566151 RepID=A0ABQ9CPN4_9PASS|nr:hypothetical protein WISP_150515 [Willisornis vidua]
MIWESLVLELYRKFIIQLHGKQSIKEPKVSSTKPSYMDTEIDFKQLFNPQQSDSLHFNRIRRLHKTWVKEKPKPPPQLTIKVYSKLPFEWNNKVVLLYNLYCKEGKEENKTKCNT